MATLGEQSIGSIVKLNVNGVAMNFIVVHQGLPEIGYNEYNGYDSSCDGTWLLMEDVYESRIWDFTEVEGWETSINDYALSSIHDYLNNTFVNLFDSDIGGVIKQIKLPYINGDGFDGSLVGGSQGISAKVFLLSYTEVGFPKSSYAFTEGAVLDYFDGAANSVRIGYLNGSAVNWWLRSPYKSSTNWVYCVGASGNTAYPSCTNSRGVRPALILPYDLNVSDGGFIETSSKSNKAIYGSVIINGVLRTLTGEGYVNINGVLRPLVNSQVNIGGVLKDLRPKEVYTWKKYSVAKGEGPPYTLKKSESVSTTNILNTETVYLCNSYEFSSTTGFTMNSPTTTTGSTLRGSSATQYISKTGTKNLKSVYKIQSVTSSGSYKVVRYYRHDANGIITQVMGDYIENVTSENASAYPDNGVHTDGYWYVKQ